MILQATVHMVGSHLSSIHQSFLFFCVSHSAETSKGKLRYALFPMSTAGGQIVVTYLGIYMIICGQSNLTVHSKLANLVQYCVPR